MHSRNRQPLLDQNRIIAIVGLVAVIALIFLAIMLVIFIFRRPKTLVRGSVATIQSTATSTISLPAGVVTQTPSPTSPPAEAFQTPTRPAKYTIQKGEWPICIARRYNLELRAFFDANGLNMESRPAPGTSLTIPAKGEWNPANGSRSLNAHPVKYTVKEGDTLASIACHYGDVYPEAILSANSLSGAGAIKAGQSLQIP